MGKASDYVKDHFPHIKHMMQATEDRFELAHSRVEICKTCEKYNEPIRLCTECNCIVPAKALGMGQYCPIGKW